MYIVNVEGAIQKHGTWLIIQRSEKEEHAGGSLSLIGGKCELEGYTSDILERTLQREIYEEVGVEIINIHYINSSSFIANDGDHVINIVFYCDWEAGEPYAKSPEEVDAVYWMTTEEILSNSVAPDYLKKSITLADRFAFQSKLV